MRNGNSGIGSASAACCRCRRCAETYQLANAAAALAALDSLRERLPVEMGAIRRGLVEVELPGRFQVLPGRPSVMLDVAHNPHAAERLAENLQQLGARRPPLAVFAMLKDKDIEGVIDATKRDIDAWFDRAACAARAARIRDVCEQAFQTRGIQTRCMTTHDVEARFYRPLSTHSQMIKSSCSDLSTPSPKPCSTLPRTRRAHHRGENTRLRRRAATQEKARRRLVGAIVLVLLVVVFVPMFLDREPRPQKQDIDIKIPPVPGRRMRRQSRPHHSECAAARCAAGRICYRSRTFDPRRRRAVCSDASAPPAAPQRAAAVDANAPTEPPTSRRRPQCQAREAEPADEKAS